MACQKPKDDMRISIDIQEFYKEHRAYMLREHREFIEDLRKHSHLREFGKAFPISNQVHVI